MSQEKNGLGASPSTTESEGVQAKIERLEARIRAKDTQMKGILNPKESASWSVYNKEKKDMEAELKRLRKGMSGGFIRRSGSAVKSLGGILRKKDTQQSKPAPEAKDPTRVFDEPPEMTVPLQTPADTTPTKSEFKLFAPENMAQPEPLKKKGQLAQALENLKSGLDRKAVTIKIPKSAAKELRTEAKEGIKAGMYATGDILKGATGSGLRSPSDIDMGDTFPTRKPSEEIKTPKAVNKPQEVKSTPAVPSPKKDEVKTSTPPKATSTESARPAETKGADSTPAKGFKLRKDEWEEIRAKVLAKAAASAPAPELTPQEDKKPKKEKVEGKKSLNISKGDFINAGDETYEVKELPSKKNGNNYIVIEEDGKEVPVSKKDFEKGFKDKILSLGKATKSPVAESSPVLPTSPDETDPAGSALIEKEVLAETTKEVEKLTKEERMSISQALNIVGHKVREKKNLLFAAALSKVSGQKGLGLYFSQLRKTFLEDASDEAKKAELERNGGLKSKLVSLGKLGGSITRVVRVVSDWRGYTMTSPLRWVMAGTMALSRGLKAGKETRFLSDTVRNETWIQDKNKAHEEALKIYEQAKQENGGGKVSRDDLQKVFVATIPDDLKRKLSNPAFASDFVQQNIKSKIERAVSKLENKVDKIRKSADSPEVKKFQEEALMKRWEKLLMDYDRMVTEIGTIDQIAYGLQQTEKLSAGLVQAMTLETLLLSADKVLEKFFDTNIGVDEFESEVIGKINKAFTNIEDEAAAKARVALKDSAGYVLDKLAPDNDIESSLADSTSKGKDILLPDSSILETPLVGGDVPSTTFSGGKGGLQGWIDFKADLRAKVPDISKLPQEIQDMLNAKSREDVIEQAKNFGFYDPNSVNESALIKEGSTLRYENGKIIFHDAGTGQDMEKFMGDKFDSDKPVMENTTPKSNLLKYDQDPRYKSPDEVRTEIFQRQDMGAKRIAEELKARIANTIDQANIPDDDIKPGWKVGEETINTPESMDNSVANAPKEFQKNYFEIPGARMQAVVGVHNQNLQLLLQKSPNMAWTAIKDVKVEEFLKPGSKYSSDPNYKLLKMYLDNLKAQTGVKDRWGFWGSRKTVSEYIARALQKAASEDMLSSVRLQDANLRINK